MSKFLLFFEHPKKQHFMHVLSDFCKGKCLHQPVANGIHHDASIGFAIRRDFDLLPFEQIADIFHRIIGFDFLDQNIAHLVVFAQILDFSDHFIFRHCDPPILL